MYNNLKYFLFSLTLFVIHPAESQSKYDFSALHSKIQNWVDKRYYPGAALMIVRNNVIIDKKIFGNYTPDTEVYIASAGKWLAAATIACVVDEGRLSWSDSVSKWLPEFKDVKGKATLRQLLSHTSGFPDYQPVTKHRDDYQTLKEAVEQIVDLPAPFTPGERFHYGGLAMQVAGRMAEIATGKDWETLFREKIADPLHMKNTHFTPVDSTPGHSPMLGGGARCIIGDYINFLSMISNNGIFEGKKILSAAAIKEMQADQIENAQTDSFEFVERMRGLKHSGIYGLGEWREQPDENGDAVLISSPGWAGAYPWIDKTRNIYGFFLTHVDVKGATKDKFSAFYTSPTIVSMVRDAVDEFDSNEKVIKGVANLEGTKLYYEIAGKGEPVILIHGHSLDRRMWNTQFYELAKHFKVIRYDIRGYGDSDMPQEGSNFLHAGDLFQLMKYLGINKAHLVGLSLGAFIAADFMTLHPENLLSVTLSSGCVYNHPGPDQQITLQEIERRAKEINDLKSKGILTYKKEWFEALVRSGGSQQENIRWELWKMIYDWQAWQPLHIEPRFLLGTSVITLIKKQKINIPVLFLYGEKDSPFKQKLNTEVLNALPGAKTISIPDAGHMLNMEKSGEYNKAVIDFISQCQKGKNENNFNK